MYPAFCPTVCTLSIFSRLKCLFEIISIFGNNSLFGRPVLIFVKKIFNIFSKIQWRALIVKGMLFRLLLSRDIETSIAMKVPYTSLCNIMPNKHSRTFFGIRSLHFRQNIGNLSCTERMFCDTIRMFNTDNSPAFVFDMLEMKSLKDEINNFSQHIILKILEDNSLTHTLDKYPEFPLFLLELAVLE